MNDKLDYEVFNNLGRDDLDVVYLGTKIDVPLWEVLLLAPPTIKSMQGLEQTDATSDSMRLSADYGMVLKVGDLAFSEVLKDQVKEGKELKPPFVPGQWVAFEEFHPQSRNINGVMVYHIADSRIMSSMNELDMWDCYLLFEENLKKIRAYAAQWRSMSRLERKNKAGHVVTFDDIDDNMNTVS